ncbi:MAG: esterase family protein [Saprospiraceae bacterium]|nr:esterase family protein [Saprospiraceae bacterium]
MSSFRTVELSNPKYECDGLRFLTIKSANLGGRGDICVFVPQVERNNSGLPINILLHGVYGSAWSWAMQGGAHHTARKLMENGEIKPTILAMPSDGLWGDGSGYITHHAKRFDEWIVHDVPLAIRENIPQARQSSSLAIGGLSMGGYGALMLGARFPEKFCAISGHSSITRLEQMQLFVGEPWEDLKDQEGFDDVIEAMKTNRSKLPAIRFDCGTSDELIEPNRILHQELTELKIHHTYEEFAGGHEWPYWQKHVVKTLRFFDRDGH